MSESGNNRLTWLFVGITVFAAGTLLGGVTVNASDSDDHDRAHDMRISGEIRPLSEILGRSELAGMRVLEAELDDESGRLVYELELLNATGGVEKRYYDAANGQPMSKQRDD